MITFFFFVSSYGWSPLWLRKRIPKEHGCCHGMLFEEVPFLWTHDQFVSSYTARYAIVMCLWFQQSSLKATLDEDPKSGVQWNRAILLNESHKLGPMVFRWGSKTKKWQIKAKPTWHHFWGKINWFKPQQKKELKRRELMIWRIETHAKVQA